MNVALLIGNVGSVIVRESGVVTLSLATNGFRKKKDGPGYDKETTWHDCVLFGRNAESAKDRVKTGARLSIRGRLKNTRFEKDGVTHRRTEIVVDEYHLEPNRWAGASDVSPEDGTIPQGDHDPADDPNFPGDPPEDDDIAF